MPLSLAVRLLLVVPWGALLVQRGTASPDTRHDGVFGQKSLFGSWNHEDNIDKKSFIDALIANMTVEDLALQLHLMFGDNIIGPKSDNGRYDYAMRFSPDSPVGNIHDFYSLNTSHYNELQEMNLRKARLPVPFLHMGECLHGVGSFQQTLFPQSLGLAASFDTDLVHRIGRALGAEARSIGVHACFSPVLDLGREPRWGRMQEGWGEDKVLTTHMGVAYASGLSKNGSWSDPDAVVPVMKHFAAHGSPEAGRNAAPYTGYGLRTVQQDLLMPFKAAVELGGVRGVMMAYNELDGIPAVVHPALYKALQDWNFDGFVIADDTAVKELEAPHRVASSPADALSQWFNAGGMIQFYDYTLETFLNATKALVSNGTVALSTLQAHVRKILGVKWDLGLFRDPLIPSHTDPVQLVANHRGLALEAAQKSIVLLKNENQTLPLLNEAGAANTPVKRIALLGPFADTLNYGDYSGTWGQTPAANAVTLRQAMLEYVTKESEQRNAPAQLLSSWGANAWEYTAQNVVPPYLLSANGTRGGLRAAYYPNTDFTGTLVVPADLQVPALDWGLFPPPGLTSPNFSAIWEGELASPVDAVVRGWLGVAVGPRAVTRLYVDGALLVASGREPGSQTGHHSASSIQGNILPWSFVQANGTSPPPGAAAFTFRPGAVHQLRIEFQAWGAYSTIENESSLRSQMLLFWNLVHEAENSEMKDDHHKSAAVSQAVALAADADVVVLAVGAAWSSDGENGDRASLGLPPSQEALVDAVLAAAATSQKPVVLVLYGGRPFAIPQHYRRAAAVLSAFFPGQAGGQAVADVLFGAVDPGGARLPRTVPRSVGQLPANYDYKPSAHMAKYVDLSAEDHQPCYAFGRGLSYTNFSVASFRAHSTASSSTPNTFTAGDNITFAARVQNTGTRQGSYTLQVYLLGRVSQVTQPVRQLVAFRRVELAAGEVADITLPPLDVDRYLRILDRQERWRLESGAYEFALREDGGDGALEHGRVTLTCV